LTSGIDVPILPVLPFIMSLGLFGWINVLVERRRLSEAYLKGQKLELKEVSTGSNHWPALAVLGRRGSLAVLVCTLGAACLAGLFGASTGLRDINGPLPWPMWMGILLMGGTFASMAGFFVYLKVADAVRTPWTHPRPLEQGVGTNGLPSERQYSFTGYSSMRRRRSAGMIRRR
jgi:hypothetical protein